MIPIVRPPTAAMKADSGTMEIPVSAALQIVQAVVSLSFLALGVLTVVDWPCPPGFSGDGADQ